MSARVRLRIPNAPGTGPILDEDDLRTTLAEKPPLVTNRHYVLDKERHGHVPMTAAGDGIHATIADAALDGDTVVLTVDVDDDEVGQLMAEHGDPAPAYAAVMVGMHGLRIAEVGLAPPPEPPPGPPPRSAEPSVTEILAAVGSGEVYALIPGGRTLWVVEVNQLVSRLDDGEDFEDAVSNAGIDSIDLTDLDEVRSRLRRVARLNKDGDGRAYWYPEEKA